MNAPMCRREIGQNGAGCADKSCLINLGVEFIDEIGCGPGVRLRKKRQKR